MFARKLLANHNRMDNPASFLSWKPSYMHHGFQRPERFSLDKDQKDPITIFENTKRKVITTRNDNPKTTPEKKAQLNKDKGLKELMLDQQNYSQDDQEQYSNENCNLHPTSQNSNLHQEKENYNLKRASEDDYGFRDECKIYDLRRTSECSDSRRTSNFSRATRFFPPIHAANDTPAPNYYQALTLPRLEKKKYNKEKVMNRGSYQLRVFLKNYNARCRDVELCRRDTYVGKRKLIKRARTSSSLKRLRKFHAPTS